jgi:hypothetical protein
LETTLVHDVIGAVGAQGAGGAALVALTCFGNV